ncbi:MAG: ABC transporter substrate-binding protein [Chloroflexi bacterium]|nr:ABC transporter substrate-binding protein [Chloroflexota bacterium]
MIKMVARMTLVSLALVLVLSVGFGGALAQDDGIPRGGIVTVSHEAFSVVLRNFSPFAPTQNPASQAFIYEPLMVWNEVDGEIIPWLATGFVWSDDLLTLTFNIREGVMWNDGETFDANDVLYTMNLTREFPALDRGAVWAFLDSVELLDDYTIQFNLGEVYSLADVLIAQTRPVPEHIWSELDDPVTFVDDDPVATGPFSVVCRLEDQVFELCANPLYWQEGRPYVDAIRYPAYPGNEQSTLALINGDIDWGGHFIPDVETTYAAADPDNFNFYYWPGGATVNLYMNTTKAPYDDVAFRRAVSQAIDYNAVVNIGMYGYTIPSDPTGLGPRFEGWASQEALERAAELGLNEYAPSAAAATLDEAGYLDVNGDGFRELPNGDPMSMNVQVVNGWTDWVTSVQIISQNLQDIGVNAQVVTPEFGEWLNNLQTGDYDISIGWSSSGYTPWNYYRDSLDSSLLGADNIANATSWSRWFSDDADALLAAFTATADPDEQFQVLSDLQMLFVENVPLVPLFPGPTWYQWNTQQFTGFPTADNYYTQGSPWSRDSNSRLLVAVNIHCIDDTACGQE